MSVERAHRNGAAVLLGDGDAPYLRKRTLRWPPGRCGIDSARWLTLGNYPNMSLAETRVEARQARVQVDRQQDPLSLRRAVQAERLQRISFEQSNARIKPSREAALA